MESLGWLNSVLANANEVSAALRNGGRHEVPPLRLLCGLTIYHQPEDPVEFMLYEAFIDEVYTRDFFAPRPDSVVMDCGANIGVLALYLQCIAPGIKVHCFEPSAATRGRLLQNVLRNSLQNSVTVHPFAVAAQNGPRILGRGRSSAESSFFVRQYRWNREQSGASTARGELVNCVDLRGAIDLCSPGQIDLLKMDVEGAEAEILEAAGEEAMKRICKISFEYHNRLRSRCFERLISVLGRYGFTIERMFSDFGTKGEIGVIRAAAARRRF